VADETNDETTAIGHHRIHATGIAIGDRCVLLRGPSGAGKSDLALRLLALDVSTLSAFGFNRGGRVKLVSDDQVILVRSGEQLMASAPETIRSRIEVRGLGIVPVQAASDAIAVRLVVDLVAQADVPRMPPEVETVDLLGSAVPLIHLHAFEVSTPLKVTLALFRQK
jgi:HPr kinase/phosphorylase